MKYSIIIPVFNKVAFTQQCLETLPPTLRGAGEGEVIVVDNASSDATPRLLARYPWVRVVRNEVNLGFAGANNQAAQLAHGDYLVLLNNDTQATPGWLAALLATAAEAGVGVVGAKLLYPNGAIQHAGVAVEGTLLGRASCIPFHHLAHRAGDDAAVLRRRDVQAVTGACMVTPRHLYDELGGLDEAFWNGYEDVDYCFKVRRHGLRVVYEPAATLVHFESQSGVQRQRKSAWNQELLEARWHGTIAIDDVTSAQHAGMIRRPKQVAQQSGLARVMQPIPLSVVLVHGALLPEGRDAFERRVRANHAPIERIEWCAATGADLIARARDVMEVRGNRYAVLLHACARLDDGWLDELIAQIERMPNALAATAAPELPIGANVTALAADARCTLLALRLLPQHARLHDCETLDGAVADLLLRALEEFGVGTRGTSRRVAELPPPETDARFMARHGMDVRDVLRYDLDAVETRLRARRAHRDGLVSIITLSWNAVSFTQLALDSIRRHTREPYEVIVVDNGSQSETVEVLRRIDDPHVRVIYNPKNLGYAGGNNVGIAAASGETIVLLNNDVVVTEGWLDGLLGAFERVRGIGVSAPRSNRVVGHQQINDATYDSIEAMHAYARERRTRWAQRGYMADRAIGLCLCIDRRVIDEIGGLDERFGLGNFEDDDFCLRVRAAGYAIFICEDVFIHHFGSQSFAANKVDYRATMDENWRKFAEKWQFTQPMEQGYNGSTAVAGGFVRERHFVPILSRAPAQAPPPVTFTATIANEAEWQRVATFVKRFVQAFTLDDGVALAIATFAQPVAQTIGARVERLIERLEIPMARTPDIVVGDEDDAAAWRATFTGTTLIDIGTLEELSPSALRKRFRREVSA